MNCYNSRWLAHITSHLALFSCCCPLHLFMLNKTSLWAPQHHKGHLLKFQQDQRQDSGLVCQSRTLISKITTGTVQVSPVHASSAPPLGRRALSLQDPTVTEIRNPHLWVQHKLPCSISETSCWLLRRYLLQMALPIHPHQFTIKFKKGWSTTPSRHG